MAEKTWAQGTPSWVDLSTSDLEGAIAFYRELFGWRGEPGAEEFGGYTTMESDGKPVAGIVPQRAETIASGRPATWNTYLAADSADAVCAAVAAAGGKVLIGPMDVGDVGRMAYCSDPQGGEFGLWQAGTHKGFQKWNEPGSVVWDQLQTTDPEGAARFYSTVFSFEVGDLHGSTVLSVGGETVASIGLHQEGHGSPGWAVVFSVEDADATAARARELGGAVLRGPDDFPFGRLALLADPQGATFSVGSAPSGG